MTRQLATGLYIVATPIGHLADLTIRAIATLGRADVIYAEDTRHSRTLTQHYGITTQLKAYHEHNGEAVRPEILARLSQGEAVALISDAGTPLISDPGFKLVRDCAAAGFDCVALPGPSAVMAALSAAGLPTDTFVFAGFLPPKDGQRRTRLAELMSVSATLVFFEAPTRIADTLATLAQIMPTRPVVVARELTKLHETLHRGLAADLAVHFEAEPARGEIVLLIGPPDAAASTDPAEIDARLSRALETLSIRDAAAMVAEAMGLPRKQIYQRALDMAGRGG